MRIQKSSCSLYSSPSSPAIFKDSTNIGIYYTHSRRFAKTRATHSVSASSLYNTRSKLAAISESVKTLETTSQQMAQTNKELKLQLYFFDQEYCNSKFQQLVSSLYSQLKELKKEVTIRQRSDKLKYQSFNSMVNSLCKAQKQTKKKIENIQCRVLRLEQIMGSANPMDAADL